MPIYNVPAVPHHITVNINNKILKLSNSHVKDSNEPILIYMYEYITPPNTVIKVNVSIINNMIKSYEIQHMCTHPKTVNNNNNNNNLLALTTLFKHDYCLFPLFYNYYKEQGVQHFYQGLKNSKFVQTETNFELRLICQQQVLFFHQQMF